MTVSATVKAGSPRPLAMFGGTFDPVHIGHLRVAWEAAELLDAEVRLVPAKVPALRQQPVASPAARVALLEAALAGQSRLKLDTRELARSGPSWTVDTLTELRTEIDPARPLLLLVGADAFARLAAWHDWQRLFDLAHIVVLTRPGATITPSAELEAAIAPRRQPLDGHWRAAAAGAVLNVPVTPLDISASAIRALLAAGREPRFLLPAACLADPALLAPYRRPQG